MRHHDRNRKLGREKRQRTALLRNLARSLILEEGIVTTSAKAKALRPYVERLITSSKVTGLSNRRRVARVLGISDATNKLQKLSERYAKRAGGYTRITRLGRVGKRVGEMARIELVQ